MKACQCWRKTLEARDFWAPKRREGKIFLLPGLSKMAPLGYMELKIAMIVAHPKVVNLLKI